jgi:hypothetical protein
MFPAVRKKHSSARDNIHEVFAKYCVVIVYI